MEVLIKRSNRNSVTIKIDSNGSVSVLCPKKYPIKEINKLLEAKKEWIIKYTSKIEQTKNQNIQFYNYSKALIFGEIYDVIETTKMVKIGEYEIKKRKNIPLSRILKNFYIELAKNHLYSILQDNSTISNLKYNNLKICSARKKWGSCDTKKLISLNYKLVMLPLCCIKYVCIHELCHTLQMNHSNKFWQQVLLHEPNYKNIKQIMKQYSFVLELL